jgi:hypothetical protein
MGCLCYRTWVPYRANGLRPQGLDSAVSGLADAPAVASLGE